MCSTAQANESNIEHVIIVTVCHHPIYMSVYLVKGKPIISKINPFNAASVTYFVSIMKTVPHKNISVIRMDDSFSFLNGLVCT